MPVVDNQLIDCQYKLILYLLELTINQVYPGLQQQFLIILQSKWSFQDLRVAFQIVNRHGNQGIE